MTDTQPMIRCTSRNSLLAMPTAMFGFTPQESVVLVLLTGNEVEFSARADLDEVLEAPLEMAARLRRTTLVPERADSRWLMLVFTEAPEDAAFRVEYFAGALGAVAAIFCTDGRSTWEVLDGVLVDEEPHDPSSTVVLAHAVSEGRLLHGSREEAVSVLEPWDPPLEDIFRARRKVWLLSPDERVELLRSLVEVGEVRGGDRAVLGSLLGEEECFAEMVAQMSTVTAGQRVEMLLRVRPVAPPEAIANVTALLALACWLDGRSALTTECLRELDEHHPDHPLGRTIALLLELAIPPSRWDED